MSLITPTTLSPGYLVLKYTVDGYVHRTGLRLIAGVNLEDTAALGTVAVSWALALQGVLNDGGTPVGWEIHNPDHIRLFEAPFDDDYTGTHADAAGGPFAALSRTLAYTGRGVGDSVFNQTGQWIGRIFVGKAYAWLEGVKQVPYTYDGPTSALWAFYDGCLVGPADFYGQHCELRTTLPVQHHALIQRLHGS